MNANIFPKKERLGLVYGRYMDDFYIISSDKLLLRRILKEIEEYIKPLRAGAATYHTATPTTCGRAWTPTSSATSRS